MIHNLLKMMKEVSHNSGGENVRFGAGLPRINDGSLLFLQHMVAKFEPVRPAVHKHGSRLAIVFSGSPLKARFLDACPHLLDDVQAIDQSLGREPRPDWNAVWRDIETLLRQRGSPWKAPEQKLFRSVFTQKNPEAEPVKCPSPFGRGAGGGGLEPDPDLRDFENIPLKEDIDAYFAREVRPHVPDAWMDRAKDKVGNEINFNRYSYKYTPPRALEEIDADLKEAEEEILRLLREVTE